MLKKISSNRSKNRNLLPLTLNLKEVLLIHRKGQLQEKALD